MGMFTISAIATIIIVLVYLYVPVGDAGLSPQPVSGADQASRSRFTSIRI
jgi:hypothetical protein